MALWVWTVSSCMMAVLSYVHSPIHGLSGNALELIVDDNLYTHMTNTLIHLAWALSIQEWLDWLALEM
jgi:hypothetical protein